MFDYLSGRLVETAQGKVVLDIKGVGISLDLPPSQNNNLHKRVGEEVTLYTRMVIKDEEVYLYGFEAKEERKLFNLMLGVSGFGPRLALSLLGLFTVSELYVAVLEENIAQLSRAHGVGRKAAQRLVLELKEKLPRTISSEELAGGTAAPTGYSVFDDISEALVALGYSSSEAAAAVSSVVNQNKELSREELLKLVLKNMAGS
ncbi:MAG: Holliday junction branch migration protein RuvA [Bacillota bacterium]